MKRVVSIILEELPFLRPVIMLTKYLLRINKLNDTFTGGIGSFLVFNMIYAYYQYLFKSRQIYDDFNLGTFFLGFLKFYAEEFNHEDLGISLRNGGYFFRKTESFISTNNSLLCVENFLDPTQDIGRNSYEYEKVRQFFKSLYTKLTTQKNKISLISLIIK